MAAPIAIPQQIPIGSQAARSWVAIPKMAPAQATGGKPGCNTHYHLRSSSPVTGPLLVYGSNDADCMKKKFRFQFLLVKKTLSASWNQIRFILCLFYCSER
ncbi:MAG: hypothetical protein APR55_01535 [Methanolinea sp. SDB]|nr:MAG: hypothetical protein APR55_01535 [Methanolinea sp. SDB]